MISTLNFLISSRKSLEIQRKELLALHASDGNIKLVKVLISKDISPESNGENLLYHINIPYYDLEKKEFLENLGFKFEEEYLFKENGNKKVLHSEGSDCEIAKNLVRLNIDFTIVTGSVLDMTYIFDKKEVVDYLKSLI